MFFVLTFFEGGREFCVTKLYLHFFKLSDLTLIRAAGGVYDFQNFERVYLHNAWSKTIFLINVFLKKPLRSTFC
jgi:hypothetical protein